MSYEFRIYERYCVDAAWFYCTATGTQFDQFNWSEVTNPAESTVDAMVRLVIPHLAKVGFPLGTFQIEEITDELIDYDGFPLAMGDVCIFFNDDNVRTITEKFPEFVTYTFSSATRQLLKLLELDQFYSTTFLRMEKLDRADNSEQESNDNV